MKKLITLLAALPLFLHAQSQGDVELGIGAGLNLAGFYGGDADGYNLRSSFQAGITGEYYLNDQWSFKTGAIYDSKGGEGLAENDIQLDYLFVPLYANFHFGMDREWYFNFGPNFNFLLIAEREIVDDGLGGTNGFVREDIEDDVASFDVGFGLGIGRKFRISENASIFIEYQGAVGFLEVPEDNGFFATAGVSELFNMRSAFNTGIIFTP